ncbi:MAG: DUF4091 domain-containing protein [Armatimonadetes bacterium]|nr:DUF4091 domain-containing protein [Armatimonadota bacterium]
MRVHLLVPFTLCLAGWAFAQDSPNLLKNPSAEELTDAGFAAGWSGGEFGKPGRNVTTDATVAHTGQHSLRVGISPKSFVTCTAAAVPAKPGTTYYLTWWVKTRGLDQGRAYVWLQTNKAQRVVGEDSQYGTTDWTLLIRQYKTGAEETSLAPVLTTQDSGGSPDACAWFDDIGLYEGALPADLAMLYRQYQRETQGVSESAVILSETDGLTLWADDLAARIYREDGVPDYAKPAPAAKLSGARGEQDYVQVALAPARDLADVRLQPADLRGPGMIPAAQVQWWPIGYVNIRTTHRQTTRQGWTPDPLLKPEPFAAPAGQNTPVLVSVTVPRDAKPGSYRGEIQLFAGDTRIGSVPLALTVRDFTLPKDPTFRTLITYSPSGFQKWDKRPLPQIEQDICQVLYAHGIRGNGATATVAATLQDGKVVCDFTAFDEKIGWNLGELGFNAFFLGPCFGGGTSEGWEKHSKWLGMEPLSEDFNRFFPGYMRQVGQHLREKGWLDKAYLYLWDEPEQDYFDKVVALQKLALQGDPDFKVWETTSPNHKEFWGVVKAWSVPFGRPHFGEENVDRRRAAGDEIWVYNIPASLEIPAQTHRLWFWQAARYGAIGAQLWNVSFYHGIDPWENPTPEPYPVGRGATGLYYYDAGQAIMIYPDKQGGPPLPCLRLKLLQKGLDDFEYLTVVQQRLEQQARRQGLANPQSAARQQTRDLAARLVRDIGKYDLDVAALAQVRDEIATRIEKLGH